MSKEAELLKKIELKVSVNCCDGCKKKVKKILQGIEGILKTEIDELQPKVTVIGNVDPKVMIKRLLKAGKQAEIWSQGNHNAGGKQNKQADDTNSFIVKEKEKEKPKTELCDQVKKKSSVKTEVKAVKKEEKLVKTENIVCFQQGSEIKYMNMVDHPITIPFGMPCYAIPTTYTITPQLGYAASQQFLQPVFQQPAIRVGDYFSDENTNGCHVM